MLFRSAGQGVEALLRDAMAVIETARVEEEALEKQLVVEAWHP